MYPDCVPPYFLYFEIDPHSIDVNVHPTKTEVNFENASDVFRLLQAGIRETLSKCDIAPAIDFDSEVGDIEMPYFSKDDPMPPMPKVNFNPFYNPFDHDSNDNHYSKAPSVSEREHNNLDNWQQLYSGAELHAENSDLSGHNGIFSGKVENRLIQVKNKYIVSPSKSGIMVIDQRRAHKRVLYQKYIEKVDSNVDSVQTLLYPIKLNLDVPSYAMAYDIRDEFQVVGFDMEFNDDNVVVIKGIPPFLSPDAATAVVNDIIASYIEGHGNVATSIKDILALAASNRELIPSDKSLTPDEMRQLIDSLFATSEPNFSPEGDPVVVIIGLDELEKRFS